MNGLLRDALDDDDLTLLVDSLAAGECNLLLGAELDVWGADGSRRNIAQGLARELAEQIGLTLDDTATLPAVAQEFCEAKGEDKLRLRVRDFIRAAESEPHPDSIFSKLARLPFAIVVTTRHDHTFDKALVAAGKSPSIVAYDIAAGGMPRLPPLRSISAKKPLVFYLCGDPVNNLQSLIITEYEMVKFVRKVSKKEPAIPDFLRTKISENRSLLVGFGVPKWHTRVILEELGKKVGGPAKLSWALGELEAFRRIGDPARKAPRMTDVETVKFYDRQFAIKTVIGDTKENVEAILARWREQAPPEEDVEERPYVFISYCSDNVARAEALRDALVRQGIECFWDQERLDHGNEWRPEVAKAIRRATAFVLLVTPELHARWQERSEAFRETRWAIDEAMARPSGFLRPIRVDDGVPPFRLSEDKDDPLGKITQKVVKSDQLDQFAADLLAAYEARLPDARA